MPTKIPRSRLSLQADLLIRELQERGRYERNRARFSAPDDDTPRPPEPTPLDSAQRRRAMVA